MENPIVVEFLPPVNELQIIEESDMENTTSDTTCLLSKKGLQGKENTDGTDSDVCLNYDSESNEKEVEHSSDENLNCPDQETSDSDSNGSHENEKDSGCEVSGNQIISKVAKGEKSEEEETPFEPPDEELANRIMNQVEFYFSDENITRDAFLLKHVKRNKEGYVSLKLISSFKRVKHLAKDWRVVAYALQKSTKLEVNEAQTKLRRVDPLPLLDQTTPSRTVVAINLPMEKPTIENVVEMFREYGEISLIRILRPGNPLPAEIRSFANKHPEIMDSVSALIEFERTESAKAAIEQLGTDGQGGMQVIELNAPVGDKKKRTQSKKTAVSKLMEGELSSSCQSSSEAEGDARFYRRRSSSPTPIRSADIPRLQRRFSANRDLGTNFTCYDSVRDRVSSCTCCKHFERRYSSSGSGYESPTQGNFRHFSMGKELQEGGYQIPALRRFSGIESCCMLRRCSRDSGSDSSGSFPRVHDLSRRYSRDSISSNESGFQRRFSRDSVSSDGMGNYRRLSRDSVGSDVFAPAFLSRSNSKDIIEMPRRSSFGAPSGCSHHPLIHSGSRTSFHGQSTCSSNCTSHLPDNVVRMPKGPDGSKGFVVPQ